MNSINETIFAKWMFSILVAIPRILLTQQQNQLVKKKPVKYQTLKNEEIDLVQDCDFSAINQVVTRRNADHISARRKVAYIKSLCRNMHG